MPTVAIASRVCPATTRPSTTWSTGSGRGLQPGRPALRLPGLHGGRPIGAPADRARARSPMSQGVDFDVIDQSDPGNVTAAVTAVDLQLGLGNTSTSGCEAADFAGFPAGNIALLQRGTCTFELKAENAAAAGAAGIVIFNQGNAATPDRQGIPAVTLTANNTSGIPVLGTTYALGATLANTQGLRMRVFANTLREIKTTFNVLAETKAGNANNVVMVGGHLDSVFDGPGINDNGSGSAAILEVAEAMQKVKPTNKVRFAWWGAEESGLVGSRFYVDSLSPGRAGPDRPVPELRHGRLAELRPVRVRRQRRHRAGRPRRLRRHRGLLQRLLRRPGPGLRADRLRRPVRLRALHRPGVGIPAGGLFTGAEGIKTAAQAALYGGIAGQQYDPCYHAACDTFSNNSNEVLDLNADAIASATLTYAMNTSSVTGP